MPSLSAKRPSFSQSVSMRDYYINVLPIPTTLLTVMLSVVVWSVIVLSVAALEKTRSSIF